MLRVLGLRHIVLLMTAITLMMEAVRTSEAVYSNETTRRYMPEGS
jgi:hypothetical protein